MSFIKVVKNVGGLLFNINEPLNILGDMLSVSPIVGHKIRNPYVNYQTTFGRVLCPSYTIGRNLSENRKMSQIEAIIKKKKSNQYASKIIHNRVNQMTFANPKMSKLHKVSTNYNMIVSCAIEF